MRSAYSATVSSLYLSYYGRPADAAGLAWWSDQLAQQQGSLESLIDAFANSAEAVERFGSRDVDARITLLYQDLLSRDPESEGLAFWREEISSGRYSLADLAVAIYDGAKGGDKTLVELRQKLANALTEQLETTQTPYDGSSAVEAARLVIQATRADASETDIDTLVSAGVELIGVASTSPAVILALVGKGSLIELLASEKGAADPVGLVRLITEVATAANGKPDALKTLVGEKSLADYLAALPKDISLGDAATAIEKGGLQAGAELIDEQGGSGGGGNGGGGSTPPDTNDTTAPYIVEAEIASSGLKVTLTFSEAVRGNVSASEFSLGGLAGVEKAEIGVGYKTVVLTLASPVAKGADVKVVYSPAEGELRLEDASGNSVQEQTLSEVNNKSLIDGLVVGTLGHDDLYGTATNDVIYGLSGDDGLSGLGGNDTLHGGTGDDGLSGGLGNDVLHGDAGTDSLGGDEGDDTLNGGDGDDYLSDSDGNNVLNGGAGNDTLSIYYYSSGINVLDGGAGDDRLEANVGDTLTGGDGKDTFVVSAYNLTYLAVGEAIITDFNPNEDRLDLPRLVDSSTWLTGYTGGNPFDPALGYLRLEQSGEDTLLKIDMDGSQGDRDFQTLIRLQGLRVEALTEDQFLIEGMDPTGVPLSGKTINGTDKSESLNGTLGADTIYGLEGDDGLNGSGGNDTLHGGTGDDGLSGGLGNDVLHGDAGTDSLGGDEGDDTLNGGDGDDYLSDSDGNNVLNGGAGNDTLSIYYYSSGINVLDGGAGDDRLEANVGDTLTGGDGKDTFVVSAYNLTYLAVGEAIITDFNPNEDRLDLPRLVDSSTWLTGYTGGNPFDPALGYLRLEKSGEDTLLKIDMDGAAGQQYEMTNLVRLVGVTSTDITIEPSWE